MKQYNAPIIQIRTIKDSNIIITSDPHVGFDDGTTDSQDAPVRRSDWSSFEE